MFTSDTSRAVALCIWLFTSTAAVHAKSVAPPANNEQALGDQLNSPLVAYARDYNMPCYADYVPTPDEAGQELSVSLAANEYEPVQIGMYIPSTAKVASRVTIRVDIDVPYEVGYLYHHAHASHWRPADEGYSYTNYPGGRQAMPRYLVPGSHIAKIEPGRSAAFWITLSPNDHGKSGIHRGTVHVSIDGQPVAQLPLTVNVYPFLLPRPEPRFGLYYRPDRIPSFWTKEYQKKYCEDMAAHGLNTAQLVSFFGVFGSDEFKESGRVPLPQTSGQWIDPWTNHLDPSEYEDGTVDPVRLVETQMALFEQAGLVHRDIPLITVQDNFFTKQMQAIADTFRQLGDERGWPEIMFQTHDEPTHWLQGEHQLNPEALQSMLAFKKVKNCRTFTALSGPSAFAWGQLHDVWIVLAGHITPEMVREAERQNAELWTYSERLRFTNLRANRFYTGLYMWGLGLQGNTSYCYAHYVYQPPAGEGSKDPVWLTSHARPSFDHINGFALPGPDGPVPGVGLEGMREGIDDYRYLQLLEARIAADDGTSGVAAEARRWLDEIKQSVVDSANAGVFAAGYQYLWELDWTEPSTDIEPAEYSSIREAAAGYIAKLTDAPGELNSPNETCTFPESGWEGEPFEPKSVGDCARALANGSTADKRAAALALAFKDVADQDVDAVVSGLVDALQHPDTRMPALVSMRTLGPRAARATAPLREQLKADDAYVRCGALLALESIGPSSLKAIASVLEDPFPMIAGLAADCLSRMGADAADALPALELAAKTPIPGLQQQMQSTIDSIKQSTQ